MSESSQNPARPKKLLRQRQVLERFPVSKSAWWKGIADGAYPKPVRLSTRCVAWLEDDIDRLIESRTGV